MIAVLSACGGSVGDGEAASTTTAPSTTATTNTTAGPTTTAFQGLVVDAEVPNRITDAYEPNIILSTFINGMRREYDPPLSDQELVDAGQAVCRFYDDHRPGAAKDDSALTSIAIGILIFDTDERIFDHPVYDTLLAWLAGAPRGTDDADKVARDAAMETIRHLAAGSVVSFCPEHHDKLE